MKSTAEPVSCHPGVMVGWLLSIGWLLKTDSSVNDNYKKMIKMTFYALIDCSYKKLTQTLKAWILGDKHGLNLLDSFS